MDIEAAAALNSIVLTADSQSMGDAMRCHDAAAHGGRLSTASQERGMELMSEHGGLTVRHHERETIELPVDFVICEEHRTQVRFSTSSAAADQHTVQGWSTDVSPGGMGLRLQQFVPRMCEGTLRVYGPGYREPAANPGDRPATVTGNADHREGHGGVIFEHRAKVRRVRMRGETASYDIGLEFLAAPGDQPHLVGEAARTSLLSAVRGRTACASADARGGAGHA